MLLAHQAAAPLASYVEKLWYCDGYQGIRRKEHVLPNGKFQVVFQEILFVFFLSTNTLSPQHANRVSVAALFHLCRPD
jgi:hypothetical protein